MIICYIIRRKHSAIESQIIQLKLRYGNTFINKPIRITFKHKTRNILNKVSKKYIYISDKYFIQHNVTNLKILISKEITVW